MGNNLALLMKEHKKSLRMIEKDLDINYTAVFKMKNGAQDISESNAKKLAPYFGVSIDYLMGYESPFTKEKIITKEVPPTYYNILAGLELCSISELEKIASIIDFLKHKKKVEAELPPNRKIVWGDNQSLPKDKK
jgi:transcriptional regulator with XRE-family HTH domain